MGPCRVWEGARCATGRNAGGLSCIECRVASRTEGDRSFDEVKKAETGVSWTGETAPMVSDVDGTLKPATHH